MTHLLASPIHNKLLRRRDLVSWEERQVMAEMLRRRCLGSRHRPLRSSLGGRLYLPRQRHRKAVGASDI